MTVTRWLVSVPVWGERYVEEFCAVGLPSLQRAVDALIATRDVDVRLVIHTDQPERIMGVSSIVTECRPVPAGARDFDSMSQAHREVFSLGLRGDIVVPFTAGAVISEQGLVYCANVLENTQLRVVLCAVPRVLQQGRIPDTDNARKLMAWAWANRHPMTTDCIWPEGRSTDLSRTYFVCGDTIVTRQALPHPLAVRLDGRAVRFVPTVDANLMHCYDPLEMHMTLNCKSLAMFKLTPSDKGYQRVDRTMSERAAAGDLVIGDVRQRWCLQHRIVLQRGSMDEPIDEDFVSAVKER